jgi:hypothetical protein
MNVKEKNRFAPDATRQNDCRTMQCANPAAITMLRGKRGEELK